MASHTFPFGVAFWPRVFIKRVQVTLESLQCHGGCIYTYSNSRWWGKCHGSHTRIKVNHKKDHVTPLQAAQWCKVRLVYLLDARLSCHNYGRSHELANGRTLPAYTGYVLPFATPVVKLRTLSCRPLQCWLKAQCLSDISQRQVLVVACTHSEVLSEYMFSSCKESAESKSISHSQAWAVSEPELFLYLVLNNIRPRDSRSH